MAQPEGSLLLWFMDALIACSSYNTGAEQGAALNLAVMVIFIGYQQPQPTLPSTLSLSLYYIPLVCALSPVGFPSRQPSRQPFDAHCCRMGTAIKHPVSYWVKLSFVIFDIWTLERSGLRVRLPRCQTLQIGLYRILAPAPAEIRHFSKSGGNPAPAKIPPEPDSFAGFEKSIFGMLNVRLFRYILLT